MSLFYEEFHSDVVLKIIGKKYSFLSIEVSYLSAQRAKL